MSRWFNDLAWRHLHPRRLTLNSTLTLESPIMQTLILDDTQLANLSIDRIFANPLSDQFMVEIDKPNDTAIDLMNHHPYATGTSSNKALQIIFKREEITPAFLDLVDTYGLGVMSLDAFYKRHPDCFDNLRHLTLDRWTRQVSKYVYGRSIQGFIVHPYPRQDVLTAVVNTLHKQYRQDVVRNSLRFKDRLQYLIHIDHPSNGTAYLLDNNWKVIFDDGIENLNPTSALYAQWIDPDGVVTDHRSADSFFYKMNDIE